MKISAAAGCYPLKLLFLAAFLNFVKIEKTS